MNHLRHAGILPYSIVKDKSGQARVCFLLGQEHPETGWADSLNWSSFGGKPEKGETPFESAAREAYEESMGFLGEERDIKDRLIQLYRDGKLAYIESGKSVTYLLPIKFDANHPLLYSQIYTYVHNATKEVKLKKKPTKKGIKYDNFHCLHGMFKDGFFEKIDIKWIVDSDLSKLVYYGNGEGNVTYYDPTVKLCKLRPVFISTMKDMYEKYPKLIGDD